MPLMMLPFLLLVVVKAGLSTCSRSVGAGAEVCWGARCSQRFLGNRDVQNAMPLTFWMWHCYMGHLELLGPGKEGRQADY